MNDKQRNTLPTITASLTSGELVEMLYAPLSDATMLCVYDDGDIRNVSELDDRGRRLIPYSPHNNLVKHRVVLFPSEAESYESESKLLEDVRAFIHRYVDASPSFEEIAAHYVLLTWVYDRFPALPYLRVRGDPGSGKTRFLSAVGSICYKPIFASGASTVSPLFRMIDAFRGTLILDESDFRFSDEKAEIIKILNNGFSRGFPVLRTEVNAQKEFNPHAYAVYGPKIIATRSAFQDVALETRCLTEEMGQGRLRDDIPITLPDAFEEEAQHLRNQLLMFRFRNVGRTERRPVLADANIEPRLKQILEPLLSVVDDPDARRRVLEFSTRLQRQVVSDRGMDVEARVLEVIRDLLSSVQPARLTVKQVTDRFIEKYGDEYERRVTPRWIGGVIRQKLHLATRKSNGQFVIPVSEETKLARLYDRYGTIEEKTGVVVGPGAGTSGDVGEVATTSP